ncbi:hypothetical protein CGCA056_v013712 [Colletotrichum aenigma]|uniref:uncharacterized protein n=1 Tax=Colletotrichum aenigma TaxID=1215731 RepID=UPI001872FB8C|nr:uncharacterized protein CGCA056_v013712 [Colletotrichum aenigma]KAF5507283.1 hypothetical protein CGCA056_v013712 [Colletotrichum aenigma]
MKNKTDWHRKIVRVVNTPQSYTSRISSTEEEALHRNLFKKRSKTVCLTPTRFGPMKISSTHIRHPLPTSREIPGDGGIHLFTSRFFALIMSRLGSSCVTTGIRISTTQKDVLLFMRLSSFTTSKLSVFLSVTVRTRTKPRTMDWFRSTQLFAKDTKKCFSPCSRTVPPWRLPRITSGRSRTLLC